MVKEMELTSRLDGQDILKVDDESKEKLDELIQKRIETAAKITEIKEENEDNLSDISDQYDESQITPQAQANEELSKMDFKIIPGSQTISKDGIIRFKYLQQLEKDKIEALTKDVEKSEFFKDIKQKKTNPAMKIEEHNNEKEPQVHKCDHSSSGLSADYTEDINKIKQAVDAKNKGIDISKQSL